MKTIKAKTLIQSVKNSSRWFGFEYNMNLYRGCCHGCIYCDSRRDCYRVEIFDEVALKENIEHILSRELAYKKKGVINMGAMSDPYNPFEQKQLATRKALLLIEQNGFGLSLATKSDLIVRDIDIFKQIKKKHNLLLKITITTADDALSKMIEPHVCESSKRFEAVKKLSNEGLFVGVLFTPWLPFITDNEENIKQMVRKASEAGARFIFAFSGVTLSENQRDYYYEKLDLLFPGLSKTYRQAFRNKYMCNTLDKTLRMTFEKECKKYGILYKMDEIIGAYKRPIGIIQETLF